jgi:hypothetical protein
LVIVAAFAGCSDTHTPFGGDGPLVVADLTVPDRPMSMSDLSTDDLAIDLSVGDLSDAAVPEMSPPDFSKPDLTPVDLAGNCGDAGCGPGLRCAGSACVCDPFSGCAGCCVGGAVCVVTGSQTASACGLGGQTCAPCGIGADGCTGGVCTCGGAASCNATQHCVGAKCTCDSFGCKGCCIGSTCIPPTSQSLNMCGSGGAQCDTCTPGGDACGANGCTCAGGPACLPGSSCNADAGTCS